MKPGAYWATVFGFIVFCAVVAGSVNPAGIVVVLIAAGVFFVFANKGKS